MPRGRKKKPVVGEVSTLDPISSDVLRTIVGEFERQRRLASEYAGNAGSYLKNQLDRHPQIDRTGLTKGAALLRKDPRKLPGTLSTLLLTLEACGAFNEPDLFEDVIDTMDTIVQRARGHRSGGEPPPGNGAELLAGLTTLNA